MEKQVTKEELIQLANNLKDGDYHIIIVKPDTKKLNLIHGLIRKRFFPTPFEEAKIIVKDRLGFFYYDGDEKKYRSFKNLSEKERQDLIYYLNGLL